MATEYRKPPSQTHPCREGRIAIRKEALLASRWSEAEMRAAESLGLFANPAFRKIAGELAGLQKQDRRLAAIYRDAVNRHMDKEGKTCRRPADAKALLSDSITRGREAVYDDLGIRLEPLPPELAAILGVPSLLYPKTLFDMLVHGRLKDNLCDIAGIESDRLSIAKAWGSTGSYRAIIDEADGRAFFVKEGSLRPDMLAAELLRLEWILVPDIVPVQFKVPLGEDCEYGIMHGISDMPGVRKAASLRALARDEELSAIVAADFERFSAILGHAFEVCRKLGIQDRHSRNVGVALMDDGSIRIYMIDLDIVACYPEKGMFQRHYSGQINTIIESVDFAMTHGDLVRISPDLIRAVVDTEMPREVSRRRRKLYREMASMFLRGAEDAHCSFKERERIDLVQSMLSGYDGNPVGWKQTPESIKSRGVQGRFTGYPINGSFQPLLTEGPHCGRFELSSKEAIAAFLQHVALAPRRFWKKTIRDAPKSTDPAIIY